MSTNAASPHYAVAVIAGGDSTRMGMNKALVDVGGQPIIERVLARVRDLGQTETLLIANEHDAYAHLGLPVYPDVMPGKGSLGGIYAAVYHTTAPHVLTVACDMPFLETDLLRYMLRLLTDETPPPDVVVPRVEDYPQGLHAIYSKGCLVPIRERLEQDRLKVIGFYPDVRVRYMDEDEYTPYIPGGQPFFNVNTPEQLAAARQFAAERLQD
jgi:molybdenum cofactor guanylyltransferase